MFSHGILCLVCGAAGMPDKCVATFLRTEPSVVGTKRKGLMQCLISGEAPAAPNKRCMVCGKASLHLTVNTETMTLQQLIDRVGAGFWHTACTARTARVCARV